MRLYSANSPASLTLNTRIVTPSNRLVAALLFVWLSVGGLDVPSWLLPCLDCSVEIGGSLSGRFCRRRVFFLLRDALLDGLSLKVRYHNR